MKKRSSLLGCMKMTETSNEDSLSLKELLLIVFPFSSVVLRKCGSLYTAYEQTLLHYITLHSLQHLVAPACCMRLKGHMGRWCDHLIAPRQIMLKAFKQTNKQTKRVGYAGTLSLPATGLSSQSGASFYFFWLVSTSAVNGNIKTYSETLLKNITRSSRDETVQGQQLVYSFSTSNGSQCGQ